MWSCHARADDSPYEHGNRHSHPHPANSNRDAYTLANIDANSVRWI